MGTQLDLIADIRFVEGELEIHAQSLLIQEGEPGFPNITLISSKWETVQRFVWGAYGEDGKRRLVGE